MKTSTTKMMIQVVFWFGPFTLMSASSTASSDTLPPAVILGSLAAFDLLEKDRSLVQRLRENTTYFRERLTKLGLNIRPGIHAIVPIIIGDTAKAITISRELLDRGVYVSGFGFPVVPQGQARLRCQVSAAHTREHLDRAVAAIAEVAEKFGVLQPA